MVPVIFYNSKTAKIDSNVTKSKKFMGVLRNQLTFLLFLIFRSIIRINFSIGGNLFALLCCNCQNSHTKKKVCVPYIRI